MTLAQIRGYLAAIARLDARRFADAAAAVRVGMAGENDYQRIMKELERVG